MIPNFWGRQEELGVPRPTLQAPNRLLPFFSPPWDGGETSRAGGKGIRAAEGCSVLAPAALARAPSQRKREREERRRGHGGEDGNRRLSHVSCPRRSPEAATLSPLEGELVAAGWELHKCKFQAQVFTVFKERKKMNSNSTPFQPPPAPPSSPSTLTQAAHPFPTRVHPHGCQHPPLCYPPPKPCTQLVLPPRAPTCSQKQPAKPLMVLGRWQVPVPPHAGSSEHQATAAVTDPAAALCHPLLRAALAQSSPVHPQICSAIPVLCLQMRAGFIPLPASLSSSGSGFPPQVPLSPFSPSLVPPIPLGCCTLISAPYPCCVPTVGSYSSITAAPTAGASQTLSLRLLSPIKGIPREFSASFPSPSLYKLPKRQPKSGCSALLGLVLTLPIPGLCPWNCHIPAQLVGVCLETCLMAENRRSPSSHHAGTLP